MGFLRGKTGFWLKAALVALGVAAVLWLAPDDKTLGSHVKLVYLHGALIWGSLILYGTSGFAGLYTLALPRHPAAPQVFRTATGAWRAAIVANAISLPIGLYAAKVIWGGWFFSEPRVLANAAMLFISLLVFGVSLISGNRRGMSGLYALSVVGFSVMLSRTVRILHPNNPIGRSDSLAIKLSFAAIVCLVLVLAWEATRTQEPQAPEA